jgi:anti-sigma factor RsiW
MISCNDYQNKIVAVLDSECSEEDQKLIFAHLAECPECRAFYVEAIRTRQLFSIAMATKAPVTIGRQFMQTVEAEAQQSRSRSSPTQPRRQTRFKMNSRRLVMAGGLAASFLVVVSWLACYAMSRQVGQLRSQLQGARQDLVVARAQGQAAEERDRQQKAIRALYQRMSELEDRFDRYSSSRATFLPAERNRRPGPYGSIKADVLH